MKNKTFIIGCVILCVSILAVGGVASRGQPAVVRTNLENLPNRIGGLDGVEDTFPESVYKELNADLHVYRHYRGKDGRSVDLYMGYYGTAKGGRTGHNPYACLPGAGWGILDSGTSRLAVDYYPDGVNVNYVLARKGETYETVLHWYQSSATKILATGIQQNVQRFIGRVLHNRNDGAFVRVSVVSGGEGRDSARKLAESFAQDVLKLLPSYWPIEN